MRDEKDSKRYRFYLQFNEISLLTVFLLPLVVVSIYISTSRPYACDEMNTVLTWAVIFAMSLLNIKQTLEIFDRYDFFEESKDES